MEISFRILICFVKLCICTKFHEYILNGFRDVKHKSTSLMVLKIIQWTLFLN